MDQAIKVFSYQNPRISWDVPVTRQTKVKEVAKHLADTLGKENFAIIVQEDGHDMKMLEDDELIMEVKQSWKGNEHLRFAARPRPKAQLVRIFHEHKRQTYWTLSLYPEHTIQDAINMIAGKLARNPRAFCILLVVDEFKKKSSDPSIVDELPANTKVLELVEEWERKTRKKKRAASSSSPPASPGGTLSGILPFRLVVKELITKEEEDRAAEWAKFLEEKNKFAEQLELMKKMQMQMRERILDKMQEQVNKMRKTVEEGLAEKERLAEEKLQLAEAKLKAKAEHELRERLEAAKQAFQAKLEEAKQQIYQQMGRERIRLRDLENLQTKYKTVLDERRVAEAAVSTSTEPSAAVAGKVSVPTAQAAVPAMAAATEPSPVEFTEETRQGLAAFENEVNQLLGANASTAGAAQSIQPPQVVDVAAAARDAERRLAEEVEATRRRLEQEERRLAELEKAMKDAEQRIEQERKRAEEERQRAEQFKLEAERERKRLQDERLEKKEVMESERRQFDQEKRRLNEELEKLKERVRKEIEAKKKEEAARSELENKLQSAKKVQSMLGDMKKNMEKELEHVREEMRKEAARMEMEKKKLLQEQEILKKKLKEEEEKSRLASNAAAFEEERKKLIGECELLRSKLEEKEVELEAYQEMLAMKEGSENN